MHISFLGEPALTLHGYSPADPSEIFNKVIAGSKPSALKGDFILIAEGVDAESRKPLTVFISTVVAAVPYFYYITAERCIHASNVLDCCKEAGLGWRWNQDAVAQLALFDHVLGNASLHEAISRVPSASIIKICDGKTERFTEPFWTELYANCRYDSLPSDATELLLNILSELPTQRYALSLSAGYDSRVLLACLANLKKDVVTACMGGAGATDPRIAQQLAHSVGYNFQRIEIDPDNYLSSMESILKTTSGELVFEHWHTGIYAKKVGFNPTTIHLAGSNGEFARSFFFDKGFVANFLDTLKFSRWDWWLSRIYSVSRRIAPEIVTALGPTSDFAKRLTAPQQVHAAYVPGLRFGDGLDVFYATQRVRNFIGLGLALYRSAFQTMSPFLDVRFIRFAAHLPRHDKLANRLQKDIIGRLRTELLDFPTHESGIPMRSEAGPFYFLEHGRTKAYQRHGEAQKFPQVIAWAHAGFRELGGDEKMLEGNELLRKKVEHWNFSITIGAFVELLKKNNVQTTS